MLDLNARVTELQEENKYQLSLRDIEYKEKINELTEKCIQQINSLNAEKEVSVERFRMKTILILEHNGLLNLRCLFFITGPESRERKTASSPC